MRNLIATTAAVTMALGIAAPAMADDHGEKMKAEVVERNAQGKVTKVKMGDKVVDVCLNDTQDSCINPREAGLKWGNRPLAYWPGKPASEM